MKTTLLLCLLFSFSLDAGNSKKSAKENKLLNAFSLSLETKPVSSKDLKKLTKLLKSKTPSISGKASALIAQYHTEITENHIEALKIIIPYILDKKDTDVLLYKLSDKKNCDIKKLIQTIPSHLKWNSKNPELCIALARILASNGSNTRAMDAYNHVGEKLSGLSRTLSAEGIGDILFKMKNWAKTIDTYKFSLQVIRKLQSSSEYQNTPDPAVNIIAFRIREKLKKAQEIWDVERYGSGFAAYRYARCLEFSKQYSLAAVYYQRIIQKFPDTVYSEAASLYDAKCILELSKKEQKETLKKLIQTTSDKMKNDEKQLRKYSNQLNVRIRKDLKEKTTNDKLLIDELKKLPAGKKAEEEAMNILENFVRQDKAGLYRGESFLVMADWYLETQLDIEKALEKYQQAADWIKENRELVRNLKKYRVPDKAAGITQPVQAMHTKDEIWGNVTWSGIKPEQVFNQFTTSWYFDWLEYSILTKRGLCRFLSGNKEQSLEDIKIILKRSPYEKREYKRGWPNSYSRLKNAFERGTMFAKKEEMMNFKGKLRTAVIVAGYYYEIEDWAKALRLFNDYKLRFGEKMNRNAKAYFDYVLGCLYRLQGTLSNNKTMDQKGEKLLKNFEGKIYRNTPTWPRAMFELFSVYECEKDKKKRMKAFKLMEQVYSKMPDTEYGKRALLAQGTFLYCKGYPQCAKKKFEEIIKKYPGTWQAKGAGNYLKKLKVEKLNKKGREQ